MKPTGHYPHLPYRPVNSLQILRASRLTLRSTGLCLPTARLCELYKQIQRHKHIRQYDSLLHVMLSFEFTSLGYWSFTEVKRHARFDGAFKAVIPHSVGEKLKSLKSEHRAKGRLQAVWRCRAKFTPVCVCVWVCVPYVSCAWCKWQDNWSSRRDLCRRCFLTCNLKEGWRGKKHEEYKMYPLSKCFQTLCLLFVQIAANYTN